VELVPSSLLCRRGSATRGLYEAFIVLLDTLEEVDIWPAVFVRFELGLLQELGFGLDLTKCAATGKTEDLIYVSPKTGRAVSREAGEPYQKRLYRLPPFLVGGRVTAAEPEDVADGLRLTGHFLERYLFGPFHGRLPDARYRLIDRLSNAAKARTLGDQSKPHVFVATAWSTSVSNAVRTSLVGASSFISSAFLLKSASRWAAKTAGSRAPSAMLAPTYRKSDAVMRMTGM